MDKKGSYQGPHGVGDPDDTRLRRVEKDVLIPKIMRDKAKEKCAEEVQAFDQCCVDTGFWMFRTCQPQNKALWACMERWFNEPAVRAEATAQYQETRRQYRLTGVGQRKPNVRKEQYWAELREEELERRGLGDA